MQVPSDSDIIGLFKNPHLGIYHHPEIIEYVVIMLWPAGGAVAPAVMGWFENGMLVSEF